MPDYLHSHYFFNCLDWCGHTVQETEIAILTKGARRCPLCFYIDGDKEEKDGQIAHLDQDSSNANEDNLAWMCLNHHSLYDSKTSQHKKYTVGEVKKYRDQLYQDVKNGELFKTASSQGGKGGGASTSGSGEGGDELRLFEMTVAAYKRKGTPVDFLNSQKLTDEQKADLYDRAIFSEKGKNPKNNPFKVDLDGNLSKEKNSDDLDERAVNILELFFNSQDSLSKEQVSAVLGIDLGMVSYYFDLLREKQFIQQATVARSSSSWADARGGRRSSTSATFQIMPSGRKYVVEVVRAS